MKTSAALTLLAAGLAQAHYTFPNVGSGAQWEYARITANHYTSAPVSSVTSPDILCYQLAPGDQGTSTYNVNAGGSITIGSTPAVYHPGPLFAYMAKVPEGTTAAEWTGNGTVWFKIYEDQPQNGGYELSWPNMNKASFTFTLPSCLSGQYLFRIEHLGLHVASTVNGVQPYLACSNLNIAGSSDASPAAGSPYLVSFPGAYSPTDPGILIDIYNNINPSAYVTPGPKVWSCGAS